jgi:hypothetical protein
MGTSKFATSDENPHEFSNSPWTGGGKIVVTPEAGGLHHRLIVMRHKRDSPDFRPARDDTEAIDANVAVAAVAEDLAARARSHSLRTLYEPWEPGGL